MEVVLYQPEIAGNVGACIRLSANTNIPLNIVKPLGFNFQENKIRRAGLDYHDLASVSMYEDWNEFKKDINLDSEKAKLAIADEQVHHDQMQRGDLDYNDDYVIWKGKKYPRKNMNEGSKHLPWEKEAHNKTKNA